MSKQQLDSKNPTSVMDFFISIASVVKKLPQVEQEQIETLVLDMIVEAEIKSQEQLQSKSKRDNHIASDQPIGSSNISLDEDEFARRVKLEMEYGEIFIGDHIMNISANDCFSPDTQKNDAPTEQYVVKVIPEAQSSEVHEEYIINVLPDNEAVADSDIKPEIKEEPSMK